MALFVLLQNFIRAIRLRRQEIDLEVDSDGHNSPQAKLLKHRKNLERTVRTVEIHARNAFYASVVARYQEAACLCHGSAIWSSTAAKGDKEKAVLRQSQDWSFTATSTMVNGVRC